METASFSGVVRAVFYLILFYYAFKLLMRIFLPILMKKAVDKVQDNFNQQQYQYQQNQQNQQTSYTNTNPKTDKPRETKKVGEYVDFEEIE